MNLEKIKELNNCATTEQLFFIDHPPDYQCPNIDEILKSLSYIEKFAKIPNHYDEDDLVDKLQQIDMELYGLDGKIEDLREAIDLVRQWGDAWKDVFREFVGLGLVDLKEYGLKVDDKEVG